MSLSAGPHLTIFSRGICFHILFGKENFVKWIVERRIFNKIILFSYSFCAGCTHLCVRHEIKLLHHASVPPKVVSWIDCA